MKFRMYGLLIASLSAIVLMSTANGAFAVSRASSHGASTHLNSHRLAARFFRHHRRSQAAFVWPYDDDFSNGYGPNGETPLDGTPFVPGDGRYTDTNGIPWDWAHRYPPAVTLSDRPYVSSCPSETVTVPDGHGGNGEINIVRCY